MASSYHDELRDKVNAELKVRLLGSAVPKVGESVRADGLSSGSLVLNVALSGSPMVGYVWGRMVELYGPEQSGKTTLALHAVVEAQRREAETKERLPVLFIDAEHALDLSYARSIGVDLASMAEAQPDYGEQALDAIEVGIRSGYRLVVVDSVAALTPRAEIEGEMGDAHVGLHARLMSQAMRKLNGVCSKKRAIIIFINQIRMKIGVMFGNPETTTGGNALKFFSTYRVEVRAPRSGKKVAKLGDREEAVESGTMVNVKVNKNKVFPPHRTAQFYVEYGRGIDWRKDWVAYLELSGAFKKAPNSKGPVLVVPRKKKAYSAASLYGALEDPDVRADVLSLIKSQ